MTDVVDSQVCQAENGQFIAFWRGNIVHKFDGALRYFGTEQAAWDFLTRRERVSSSIVIMSPAKRNKAAGRE